MKTISLTHKTVVKIRNTIVYKSIYKQMTGNRDILQRGKGPRDGGRGRSVRQEERVRKRIKMTHTHLPTPQNHYVLQTRTNKN